MYDSLWTDFWHLQLSIVHWVTPCHMQVHVWTAPDTPELLEWCLRLLEHLIHHQCSDPKFYCRNPCLCILKFLLLGDCKFVSQGLRLKRSMLFMDTTAMGSKLKFVIQCLIVGFSSICDAALNVSITLDHCKNMYADDPTSLLPCLTSDYLLLRED